MKRYLSAVLVFLFCFVAISGCTGTKRMAPPPKKSEKTDSDHLTAEQQGLKLTVSRGLRSMSSMIKSSKPNYEVKGTLVKLKNNSENNILISPDFVTLKTTDGAEYKYSPELSEFLGKSTFIKRRVPPDYEGGGIMLFEIKSGATPQSLIYKDNSGHNMTIKFNYDTQSNV